MRHQQLKESNHSPFRVANGSREQTDKNGPVTLGLLSINISSAWKTTGSWMTGGWRRHPSTPSSLQPPVTPHCLQGILQVELAVTRVRQGWCPHVTPRPLRVSRGAVLADLSIAKLHVNWCLSYQPPVACVTYWRELIFFASLPKRGNKREINLSWT